MSQPTVNVAIALAPEWREIDLLAPGAEQIVDSPLAAGLQRGARGGPHARLLLARSLFAATDAGEPLAAGLSVTLADPQAPVSTQALEAEDFEDCEVSAVTFAVGSGLRVKDVAAHLNIGHTEVPVLRVQYLLHTDHGLLTITLTTPQAARIEEWERLFDAIAGTAELAVDPGSVPGHQASGDEV